MKTASSNWIIPKEQLSDIQRWQLNPLAQRTQGTVRRDPAEPPARPAGFDEGFSAGQKAGQAVAAQLSAAESARLATLLASARAGMVALGASVARDTVELAMAIAEQVVRRELTLQPDAIVAVVEEALTLMSQDMQDAQLHLHPMDAKLVQERIGEDLARNHWRIVSDERMSPGGCRVSAACGDIDATIETRWASVLTAIGNRDEPNGQ